MDRADLSTVLHFVGCKPLEGPHYSDLDAQIISLQRYRNTAQNKKGLQLEP